MSFVKLPFIAEWLTAWALLWRNKGVAIASILVDVVFFIAFGLLTRPVFDKLTEHVIIIGSLVSAQLQAPAGRVRPAVVDTLFQEPVRHYTLQFLGLLAVLAVAVFVLFWLLQGLNWWLAVSLAGGKLPWKKFALGFARVNALWFALFAAWYALDMVFDLRRLVIEKALGQPAGIANAVLSVVLVLIAYFALLSYPSLSVRKAFVSGFRRIAVVVPAFLLVIAHFLAGNLVVNLLAQVNATLMFVLGALILFALFAWARVYIARLVHTHHV